MTNNILERLRGRYIICHAMSWAPFAYFFVVPSLPRTKKYEKGAAASEKDERWAASQACDKKEPIFLEPLFPNHVSFGEALEIWAGVAMSFVNFSFTLSRG